MSLGWGLRGSIGGGSLGAMIPGAMIGLVLCLLLGRQSDAGLIAAFAAVGVGFGGQETYGQTVGLSLQPDTFWWAILGFVIKGAAWGLLAAPSSAWPSTAPVTPTGNSSPASPSWCSAHGSAGGISTIRS